MLLVPSATRVERTDAGADDLLRRLAALLPDSWIVAGTVASKPVSDTCCRGYTRPFDAIIIGDRLIFVLDIWSRAGLIANRQKIAFFASFDDKSLLPDGFWSSFRRETEKLKALLHDRFEVEPGRVVPDKIWSRAQLFDATEAPAKADSADLRSFARAAIRQDKASSFRPLPRKAVDRMAAFLTEVARVAPEPGGGGRILRFTDESPMPDMADRTPAVCATPAGISSPRDESRPISPASEAALPVAEAVEGAGTSPVLPSHSTQAELSLEQGAPVAPPARPAPIAAATNVSGTDSPALEAAPPVVAEGADAAVPSPMSPSDPIQSQVSLSLAVPIASSPTPASVARHEEAAELILTEADALAPRVKNIARPAVARRTDGNGAFDGALPATAKSPPKAPSPVIADAVEARAAAPSTYVDASLEQAATSASMPAERRPTARRNWLTGLLLLLLASQTGAIAWLALFDRASPHLERAAPAPAPAPAPAAPAVPALAAPVATPFVVRALAASEPMLVGSERVIVRAGPSPDFPAVSELGAGTEVVASANASGPGGSSWIEIKAANGAVGFVPDGMVEPRPAPVLAIEHVAPPKQIPVPKIERAVASKPKPARKTERATKPKRALPEAVPAPPGIACILPNGEEIQASISDCRARSGIIYQ